MQSCNILLILYFCRSYLWSASNATPEDCQNACEVTDTFRGISYAPDDFCICHYDADTLPSTVPATFFQITGDGWYIGTGPVVPNGDVGSNCYKYHQAQSARPSTSPSGNPSESPSTMNAYFEDLGEGICVDASAQFHHYFK